MTQSRYSVSVPDTEFYRQMVKCQAACPVQTDARAYVTAVAQGDLARGYQIAREPNPLSSMCGRICGAPCEIACRRGDLDEPIAIRPLKRVLTERYGPEAELHLPSGQEDVIPLQTVLPAEELDQSAAGWSRSMLEQLAATKGRKKGKVALIGAGPASLSAAHDLALLGHKVTIYEAGQHAGGMIRYGVPSYRIEWPMMDAEIQEILDLGVEIEYNTPIGKDLTLQQLRKKHDAVFLGVGLMKSRNLNIEGNELDGVIKAVDLLLNFNLGYKVHLGQKVIVIGGGDVAMDAARTAIRAEQAQGSSEEEVEAIHDALDVARTALRMGAREVHIMALEDWDELPASQIELEEAIEEGIQVHTRLGPNKIMGEGGKVSGFETRKVASVFDEEGRFNPQFVAGSEQEWDCETVILAIGQMADLSLLGDASDIEINPRGYVAINPETGQTSAKDVFAGGDAANGPRLLIHAVRDGHLSALGIDEFIQGKQIKTVVATEWENLPDHKMPEKWMQYQREKVPTLPLDRRTGITQVEVGYNFEQAEIQGLRCLECSINTIFDGEKCILCNSCVDVCPWDCLKIVSLADLEGDEALSNSVKAHTGLRLEEIRRSDTALPMAAMLKDDEACTRCALCADRCPTNAITMESFRFTEALAYE